MSHRLQLARASWLRHHERVVVLHDQPTRATLHHDERPDLTITFVFHTVRRREPAQVAGHGRHGHVWGRHSHVHLCDSIRHALQDGVVYLQDFLQDRHAPIGSPSKWIDVVPIVGREICRTVKSVRIEGGIERLNGGRTCASGDTCALTDETKVMAASETSAVADANLIIVFLCETDTSIVSSSE